jgi:hypothetical protein
MYIQSLKNNIININNQEDLSMGDLLCIDDIAIGVISKMTLDWTEITLFSNIFQLNLGENTNYYFTKLDNSIFIEYLNKTLTINSTLQPIKWEEDFEFQSIIDQGCRVKSQDIIGYIKYQDTKYPVLVPDGIYDGVIMNNNPLRVSYSQPINIIEYQGLQIPINIYQEHIFALDKYNYDNNTSLVLPAGDMDQDLLKILHKYNIIVHISSKMSVNAINTSIANLRGFFDRAGVIDIPSLSFSDYPHFNSNYTQHTLTRCRSMLEQLLIRGFNILCFVDGISSQDSQIIQTLAGDYRNKSNRTSSLRVIYFDKITKA